MFWPLFFLTAVVGLAALRARLRVASVVLVASVLFYGAFGGSWLLFLLMALLCLVVLVPLNVPALRQEWLSRPALLGFRRLLKALNTETLAALEMPFDGLPNWDFGLLDGQLDWLALDALPPAQPSANEQTQIAALLAEFRRLCEESAARATRLRWLQQQGLFGLGIAEIHGGLGWSPCAQSAAIAGIAAIDPPSAAALAAAGRLIWIELLQQRGTPAQIARFLPELASGRDRIDRICEVPAGSGVVVRTQVDGATAIGLRLRVSAPMSQIGEGTLLA